MKFLQIIHEILLCNEGLSNLENTLQRNLRTDRARESRFWVSGGTNFENFLHSEPAVVVPFVGSFHYSVRNLHI